MAYTIGIDFGSDSVRAILVDTRDGSILSTSEFAYPRWKAGLYCDASRAQFRQHPLDYLEGTEAVVRGVLAGQDASQVRGIGIDTTGSTPCAVDASGVPLALHPEFAENPDAMFVLWKDHTGEEESEAINRAAHSGPVDYTRYEGGCYSPEWFWSKYLHVLRHGGEALQKACHSFVEHCDWITACLTGGPVKASRCAAGHKAMWHPDWDGLPPEEFLSSVDPLLAGRRAALYRETCTADQPVGTLSPEWAARLGLPAETVVAVGVIDCHAGAVGAGVRPGTLVKVVGTSTCDLLVTQQLTRCIPGICGQVDGSVLPGYTGLEAGQSAFGDVYAWFRRFLGYAGEVSLTQLERDAAALPPGQLLALDWLNGRRTPYADSQLTGAVFGLTLGTTAPMVYRALVEATLFGSRRIFDHLKAQGLSIDCIRAGGGITKKSSLVMQGFADVLGQSVGVVASELNCALGGAIFGAVASGCYPDMDSAVAHMASPVAKEYCPESAAVAAYEAAYRRYCRHAELVEAAR